jgi:hypothetical protein
VELITEVECFAHPSAEFVVVDACKDTIPREMSRRHEKRLPAL